eukprot:918066-Pleurochrysis_carterae.AAC.1
MRRFVQVALILARQRALARAQLRKNSRRKRSASCHLADASRCTPHETLTCSRADFASRRTPD